MMIISQQQDNILTVAVDVPQVDVPARITRVRDLQAQP